jgi:hypothetical protein
MKFEQLLLSVSNKLLIEVEMLPSFLGPLTPLSQLLPPAPLPGEASTLPIVNADANVLNFLIQKQLLEIRETDAKKLDFSMQRQEREHWCWAANASSVSKYFKRDSKWSQCAIATACLEGKKCCDAPGSCDRPYTLIHPLEKTGNLVSEKHDSDSWEDLQAQINNSRPVCCYIMWDNDPDNGHFVTVSGYDSTTNDVIVNDPLYGPDPAPIPYHTFVTSYRGSGRWDYSHHTQA